MKFTKTMFLVFAFFLSAPAFADQAAKVQAEKMLDALDMTTALDRIIDVTLESQIKQHPEMAPFKAVLRTFFGKYMSYAALKPQMIEIYSSELTVGELEDATAFYASPTGKRIMEKLPALMTRGADLGQKSIQDHIPELQDAIKKESERLKALQESSPTS